MKGKFWMLLPLLLVTIPVQSAAPAAYRPSQDDTVLAAAAIPRDAAGRELATMRRTLAGKAGDLDAALGFARAAIALGRAEQDPRYFGYAEAALTPWWSKPAVPPPARLQRAILRQWQHRFAEAGADLDTLIAADGAEAAQAHLLRASLAMVRGEPEAALRDCSATFGRTDLLATTACIATANGLRGRAANSLAALEALLPRSATAPVETQRWARISAAEIAVRLGESARAEKHYRAALQLMGASGVRDPYLLASYADALLAWNRPAEVLDVLRGLERIDVLLLRLALAEDRLGADRVRREALGAQLATRFADARARGDTVHQREYAWFLLDLRGEPQLALNAALANWQAQREVLDARLLLRAAVAAQRPESAQPVLDWGRRTGVEDQELARLRALLPAAVRR